MSSVEIVLLPERINADVGVCRPQREGAKVTLFRESFDLAIKARATSI